MNETINYKEDIERTRVGCLGGSDAAMLAQIASLGYIPKSAYKRLAICKGLIEQQNITTQAMLYGDFVEQEIFRYISSTNDGYQSNPCLVSEKYSRKNVKCIDHVDILLQDDKDKTLYLYEVKATKKSVEETMETYNAQLYHHYLLGKELCKKLGGGYGLTLKLVHYDTSNVDMDAPFEFDAKNITIMDVNKFDTFDMGAAMDLVNDFLETFNEYIGDGDEIDASYLPETIKAQFNDIVLALKEIKERETKVDEFKKRLYNFLCEKGIKSVSNDVFSMTLVFPAESKSFDHKKYLADEMAKHPRKTQKIIEKYTKTIKKSGFVKISLKEKKTNND